jgi:hypothetical protein
MRARGEVARWEAIGRPVPPPHAVKIATVRAYAQRFATPVLVETGTFMGDMVAAVQDDFREIFSMEIDPRLCEQAGARFAWDRHIHILGGDSAKTLNGVVCQLHAACLFWLDAHYSGGVTGRSTTDTPIMTELEHILAAPGIEPVILIDDARLFVGQADYPTVAEVRSLVARLRPDWTVEVENDIIRVHKGVKPQ